MLTPSRSATLCNNSSLAFGMAVAEQTAINTTAVSSSSAIVLTSDGRKLSRDENCLGMNDKDNKIHFFVIIPPHR